MSEFLPIDPKKWLGDSSVLLMDWDCKAMHWHLMLIAWQNQPLGTIPNDDDYICKILNIQKNEDFIKRIKPQLLTAWKLKGKTLFQKGLIETFKSIKKTSKKKTKTDLNIYEEINKIDSIVYNSEKTTGVVLDSILFLNPEDTILYQKTTKEEKQTIWNFGVSLLLHSETTESKIRAFLGKLVREYSEKKVAEAIGKLGAKAVAPIHAQSYLIGILKNDAPKTNNFKRNTKNTNATQNKGKVVL